MDTQTFQNVDAGKWERIKAAVKSKLGITISSDDGQAKAKGITLGWIYLPQSTSLAVSLIGREFFDPDAPTIDTDIATWIGAA
jgi:hypothetical protein